jgi:uncharacterized protein
MLFPQAHNEGMRTAIFLLLFSPIFMAFPVNAASFDCSRARAVDEHAVCASRTLSESDVEMAVRFEMLAGLVAMGTRGDMGDAQRVFLASRRRCGSDARCLSALYHERIAVLKREYETLKQRGPF